MYSQAAAFRQVLSSHSTRFERHQHPRSLALSLSLSLSLSLPDKFLADFAQISCRLSADFPPISRKIDSLFHSLTLTLALSLSPSLFLFLEQFQPVRPTPQHRRAQGAFLSLPFAGGRGGERGIAGSPVLATASAAASLLLLRRQPTSASSASSTYTRAQANASAITSSTFRIFNQVF